MRSTSSPVSTPGRLSIRIVSSSAATGDVAAVQRARMGHDRFAGEHGADPHGTEVERRWHAIDRQHLVASQLDLGGDRYGVRAVGTDLGDRGRKGDDLVRPPIAGRPHIGAGDRDPYGTPATSSEPTSTRLHPSASAGGTATATSAPVPPTVISVIGEKSPVG